MRRATIVHKGSLAEVGALLRETLVVATHRKERRGVAKEAIGSIKGGGRVLRLRMSRFVLASCAPAWGK